MLRKRESAHADATRAAHWAPETLLRTIMSSSATISEAVVRASPAPFFLADPRSRCSSLAECRAEIATTERSTQRWHDSFHARNHTNGGGHNNGASQSSGLTLRGDACATLEACRDDWEVAQATWLMWRRAAGILSCQQHGAGPTGGFCQHLVSRYKKTNECIAHGLASELALLFDGASVLDLGCGLGQYGAAFANSSSTVRWLGLDGAEGIAEATGGRVKFADLADGIPPAIGRMGPWDWTMSLEVGEHVPAAAEPVFMHSLISLARKGVVVSWAAPNQGGRHHVNCQPREYVTCALGRMGFDADEALRERLASKVVKARARSHTASVLCSWLHKTVMAFRPRPGFVRRSPDEGPMPLQQYEEQVARACNRTKHYCG